VKVVPKGWNAPISVHDLSIGERTALAIAAAIFTGMVAAVLADAVMESTHFSCEWETRDQEAGNHWACPSYFLPLATVAGGAAGALLLTYVAFELWIGRSRRRDSNCRHHREARHDRLARATTSTIR
jgi:hypothetical protein